MTLAANGFTNNGYTFGGWTTTDNGTTKNYDAGQSVTEPGSYATTISLYAVWTPNQVVVTFDPNDGKDVKALEAVAYSANAEITLPDAPTRDGYTFVGWAKTSDAAAAWAKGDKTLAAGTTGKIKLADYELYSSTTLYAVWTPKQVTVTFSVKDDNKTPGNVDGVSIKVLTKDAVGATASEWTVMADTVSGTTSTGKAQQGYEYSSTRADEVKFDYGATYQFVVEKAGWTLKTPAATGVIREGQETLSAAKFTVTGESTQTVDIVMSLTPTATVTKVDDKSTDLLVLQNNAVSDSASAVDDDTVVKSFKVTVTGTTFKSDIPANSFTLAGLPTDLNLNAEGDDSDTTGATAIVTLTGKATAALAKTQLGDLTINKEALEGSPAKNVTVAAKDHKLTLTVTETFAVTFNANNATANGGTATEIATQYIKKGGKATVLEETETLKNGDLLFLGWFTTGTDGKETEFKFGDDGGTAIAAATEVKARWGGLTFTANIADSSKALIESGGKNELNVVKVEKDAAAVAEKGSPIAYKITPGEGVTEFVSSTLKDFGNLDTGYVIGMTIDLAGDVKYNTYPDGTIAIKGKDTNTYKLVKAFANDAGTADESCFATLRLDDLAKQTETAKQVFTITATFAEGKIIIYTFDVSELVTLVKTAEEAKE